MTTCSNGHHLGLDTAELIELSEFCEFLRDWFVADADTLAASLRRFSYGLFPLDEIATNLEDYARLFHTTATHSHTKDTAR